MVKKNDFINGIIELFNSNLNKYLKKQNVDVLFKGNYSDLLEILKQTLLEYLNQNKND